MSKRRTTHNQYAALEVDALCLECGFSRPTTLATFWSAPGADERDLRCVECKRTTTHGRVWRLPQRDLPCYTDGSPRGDDWRERTNSKDSADLAATFAALKSSEKMLADLGVRLEYRSVDPDVGAWMVWNRGPAGDWWDLYVADDLPMDQRCKALGRAWMALLPCNNRDWLDMEWKQKEDEPGRWSRARYYRRSTFEPSKR